MTHIRCCSRECLINCDIRGRNFAMTASSSIPARNARIAIIPRSWANAPYRPANAARLGAPGPPRRRAVLPTSSPRRFFGLPLALNIATAARYCGPSGATMTWQDQYKPEGSAAELFQRDIVARIASLWAKDLVDRACVRGGERRRVWHRCRDAPCGAAVRQRACCWP